MFAAPPRLEDAVLHLDDKARNYLAAYFTSQWIAASAAKPEEIDPLRADGMKQAAQAAYRDLCVLRPNEAVQPNN